MKKSSLIARFLSPMGNERGIALVIGLVIMVLLVVLGGIMLYVTRTEIKVTSNYEQSIQALHAAEAGAEKVYDAFKNGNDPIDATCIDACNDLDGNGTIDFTQVFTNGDNIGSDGSRIEVNSGNTRAFVWVDACSVPSPDCPSNVSNVVVIISRGSPDGTNALREVTLTITSLAQDIIGGSLNNSVPE